MSHFAERLLLRSGKNIVVSGMIVSPVLTPDMVPEMFKLPESELAQYPLPSLRDSDAFKPVSAATGEVKPLLGEHTRLEQKLPSPTPETVPVEVVADQRARSPSRKRSRVTPAQKKESMDGSKSGRLTKSPITPSLRLKSDREKLDGNRSFVGESKKGENPVDKVNAVDTSPPLGKSEEIAKLGAISAHAVVQVRPVNQIEDSVGISNLRSKGNVERQAGIELAVRNSEPSVTISIRRIEVRAVMPEKPPLKEPAPALSLEDYLKRRREGSA